MACCCQATSHYLSQCWPGSVSYSITRPQWVNRSFVKAKMSLMKKLKDGVLVTPTPWQGKHLSLEYPPPLDKEKHLSLEYPPPLDKEKHLSLGWKWIIPMSGNSISLSNSSQHSPEYSSSPWGVDICLEQSIMNRSGPFIWLDSVNYGHCEDEPLTF